MADLGIDEDTKRTVAAGRETLGDFLSTAQRKLQVIFIVFVVGLMGSIWILRAFVWEQLRADLFGRMPPPILRQTSVVAQTPFDVILLQAKIGIVVGLVMIVPVIVYYSSDSLRSRGIWPDDVPILKVAGFTLAVGGLFTGGVAYAYVFFFPLMFDFLATNAINAGFTPAYSIVKWVHFIVLLALSFGLAAQLPLVMASLSLAEIVPYETFRDKWKIAVLVLYGGGAMFTPPDPITQLMWATPLVGLYALSLRMTKTLVIAKRSGEALDVRVIARQHWNVLAGSALVGGVVTYAAVVSGGLTHLNTVVASLPDAYRPRPTPNYDVLARTSEGLLSGAAPGFDAAAQASRTVNPVYFTDPFPDLPAALGVSRPTVAVVLAVVVGLLVALVVLYRTVSKVFASDELAMAAVRDPEDVDVGALSTQQVRDAPLDVFRVLDEDEATAYAGMALQDDNPEKAEAILARFDAAQSVDEAVEGEAADGEAPDGAEGEAAGEDAETDEEGNVLTNTATGMFGAFVDDEPDEDDIGGYYRDVTFIIDSLTSKAFRIVGVFMVVSAAIFMWLYQGGMGTIKEYFVGLALVEESAVNIVTLHPVEHLVFEIKVGVLVGLIFTVPMILYYAWPALKERGYARGDRRTWLVWGGSMILGVTVGGIVGFALVAPTIISWLVQDSVRANMIIAYQIKNFGWLVVYTTVGVGLLGMVPVSMVLFHYGGILTYAALRRHWRVAVLGSFVVTMAVTSQGVAKMLVLGLPIAATYVIGLGVVWLFTFGGRWGPEENLKVIRDRV
ncbi:twin-arginine translocase subunit TatC [Halococcoides cellulosivorans]|uniref:Preprotein translocase subunit TatC n=1 Tax=Halococcoides cellulosivorans TaxID=1679096 RepID=A0A2R4X312_9EURY|nr:twin-arginine translocase subunit TatC [Halococcoides cellulosivorans]AWB28199.1 preprotein translocase subunit TatC [Halococcoides cellulosivorans]